MGIAILVIVGVALWFVWSQANNGGSGSTPFTPPFTPAQPRVDDAEKIARERYARGEIDRDAYDRLITTLRSH